MKILFVLIWLVNLAMANEKKVDNSVELILSAESLEIVAEDKQLSSFVLGYANQAYFHQDFKKLLDFCVLPDDKISASYASQAFQLQMRTTHAADISRVSVSVTPINKPYPHPKVADRSVVLEIEFRIQSAAGEVVDTLKIDTIDGEYKYILYDPRKAD